MKGTFKKSMKQIFRLRFFAKRPSKRPQNKHIYIFSGARGASRCRLRLSPPLIPLQRKGLLIVIVISNSHSNRNSNSNSKNSQSAAPERTSGSGRACGRCSPRPCRRTPVIVTIDNVHRSTQIHVLLLLSLVLLLL